MDFVCADCHRVFYNAEQLQDHFDHNETEQTHVTNALAHLKEILPNAEVDVLCQRLQEGLVFGADLEEVVAVIVHQQALLQDRLDGGPRDTNNEPNPAPDEPRNANDEDAPVAVYGAVGGSDAPLQSDIRLEETRQMIDGDVNNNTDFDPFFADDPPPEPLVECQCCFDSVTVDEVVQCFEGHLFCRECMRRYAQSTVGGEGRAKLSCMTEDCRETFPRSCLEICLEEATLKALDEREQEESVRTALERETEASQCPYCPFKVLLPLEEKVLECQNMECLRETCRSCKKDWDEDHFGIPCRELENRNETDFRKNAEEEMSKARLRFCHKCKTALIKEEGCNKLTCRCGAVMCYICRQAIQNYDHFCQHSPTPCQSCRGCSLWSSPKEDDDRAIEEIRQRAENERTHLGYNNERRIGTTI